MSDLPSARRDLELQVARLDEAMRRELGRRPRALVWRLGLLAGAVGIFLALRGRSPRSGRREARG